MAAINTDPRLSQLQETIERKNLKKLESAPFAVPPFAVFITTNFNYSAPPFIFTANTQYLISLICKTHHLVLKIINSGKELGVTIATTQREIGRPINALFITAHGDENSIVFGEDPNQEYTTRDVHPDHFRSLASDASIHLFSCKTGMGLAKRIAEVQQQNQIVFAPKNSVYSGHLFLSPFGRGFAMIEEMGQHNYAIQASSEICLFKKTASGTSELPVSSCFHHNYEESMSKRISWLYKKEAGSDLLALSAQTSIMTIWLELIAFLENKVDQGDESYRSRLQFIRSEYLAWLEQKKISTQAQLASHLPLAETRLTS